MSSFIPLAQFAKKVGMSRQNIYYLIKKHKLVKGQDYIEQPTYHIGIKVREDLDPSTLYGK